MNVVDYLLELAPDDSRGAIIDSAGEMSYSKLRRGIDGVAAWLYGLGLPPQSRVALIAENSSMWAAGYLGILKAGLTAIPLPPQMSAEEFGFISESTEPKAAIVSPRFAEKFAPLLGSGVPALSSIPACAEAVPTFDDFDDRRFLAALMFTSGSTGRPRGVMVSHRNIIANTGSITAYLELTSVDRILAVLPFYYCFGTSLLHTHLRAGASIVVDSRFMFPDKVLENMRDSGCTGFAGVPATYQILLRQSSLKRMQFPSLRYVQQAGGKLPDEAINEFRAAVPAAQFFVMYGQTEATARLSYLPPELLDLRKGSIGMGIPGVRLMVLNDQDRPVDPGEPGQIVAEGDNITLGYWDAPEETAACFHEGRLYTGDIGVVDAEGFIYIQARSREFLKLAGYRVSCHQIEEVILRFPGIVEAAVLGMSDPIQGEAVCLFAAHPQEEAVRQELRAYCVRELPVHHQPKRVILRAALPRNHAGKIDRMALKMEMEKA